VTGVVVAHQLMLPGHFTPLPGGVLNAGWTVTIDLPPDAQVRAVGMLKNMPVIWECHTAVDADADMPHYRLEPVPQHFLVVADGYPHEHEDATGGDYVGTILPPSEAEMAWHVFTTHGELRDGEVPQ